MSSSFSLPRTILVTGLLVLSLSACGRRGAPQPPPDASAPQAQQGTGSQATLPSPVGTPRSTAPQGYTIPNRPFVLDPLL